MIKILVALLLAIPAAHAKLELSRGKSACVTAKELASAANSNKPLLLSGRCANTACHAIGVRAARLSESFRVKDSELCDDAKKLVLSAITGKN